MYSLLISTLYTLTYTYVYIDIHFGQISVQRAVLTLKALKRHASSVDVFIEEAVVRRELAENFCYYGQSVRIMAIICLRAYDYVCMYVCQH